MEDLQSRENGVMEMLGRIHADIAEMKNDTEWVKAGLTEIKENIERKEQEDKEKYAPKYIEKIVWLTTAGVLMWALTQLMNLIPAVKAIL